MSRSAANLILDTVVQLKTVLRIRHARAKGLLERVPQVRTGLAAFAMEAEVRFVECAGVLHEQARLTKELRDSCQQLRDEAGNGVECVLKDLAARVESTSAAYDRAADKVAALSALLDKHRERVESLRDEQRSLLPLFATLKPLGSSFRIEAARLKGEAHDAFDAVTAEISRLDAEIRDTFDQQTANLSQMHLDVTECTQRLREQVGASATLASAHRESLRNSIRQLDEERREAQSQIDRIDEAGERMDRHIDAISMGLQYQDITRQKLDHVQEVLDEFLKTGLGDSSTRGSQLRHTFQIQCGQLAAVDSELQQAEATIAAGLSDVVEELSQMGDNGSSLERFRETDARLTTMVNELSRGQETLAAGLATAQHELVKATAHARRFAEVTTASGALRRLAEDLKLMGLNAQIKSVQVRNGGLEVLSREAAHISIEAGRRIHAFDEQFVEAAAELSRGLHAVQPDGGPDTVPLAPVEIPRTVRLDTTARSKALDTAVASFHSLLEVANVMRRVNDFSTISRLPIQDAISVLEQLALIWEDSRRAEAGHHGLDALQSRYTMEAEREVHRNSIGEALDEESGTAASPRLLPGEYALSAVGAARGPAPAQAFRPETTKATTTTGSAPPADVEFF